MSTDISHRDKVSRRQLKARRWCTSTSTPALCEKVAGNCSFPFAPSVISSRLTSRKAGEATHVHAHNKWDAARAKVEQIAGALGRGSVQAGGKDAADSPDTGWRAGRRGESPGGGAAAERVPSLHLRQLHLTEESPPGACTDAASDQSTTTTTTTMMKVLG